MAVHVAITRKVFPGKEQEFNEALLKFLGESFLHGGVMGAGLITSIPGAEPNEIGILRTFANEQQRDAFYNSKEFRDWDAYASTLTEPPVFRHLKGLEAWFRSPVAPPRWKMAVATLCGVFPTSLFLALTIGPLIQSFPVLLRSFIIAACMVGLLTWVVMPQVIRMMKKWLHRPD